MWSIIGMKNIKIFVIYFPVTLVALQIMANLFYFIAPGTYYATGFYLNLFLGTNVLFALFLLAFTVMFRFCAVSRYAALAECMFALFYLIVQKDDVYNILFQIGVGVLAMIATFWHYVKKFPLCGVSLFARFIANIVKTGSCRKGIDAWDRNVRSILLKQHHQNHGHNIR